jgi:transcriptional antiterminator RfaH
LHVRNIKSTWNETRTAFALVAPIRQFGYLVSPGGGLMPILTAEPAIFPDDLLTLTEPQQLPPGRWTVLHVRPRQEKSLARDLVSQEIPFFLPLRHSVSVIRGRKMTAHLPLFDGYLFLFSEADAIHSALASRRVANVLAVADQARLWSDLRRLHGLIAAGLPLTPEPTLVAGQLVEIASGPLSGFRGRVIRAASGCRFVVEVDFIGRAASVLCDGMTLRPVPPAPE